MKQLVAGIIILILGVTLAFNGLGITLEENKIEETVIKENVIEEEVNIEHTYINDFWFENLKKEFTNAYVKGIKIDACTYLHDGTLYSACGDLRLSTDYIVEGKPFNMDTKKFYEEYFCKIMKDAGMPHPYVEIWLAGRDKYNKEIYIMEFGAMMNLNEFSDEKLGNFHIGNGNEMAYNRCRVAFTAPEY